MKDADQIAQGIADTCAHLFNCLQLSRQDKENYEAVVQEIATALREHGETKKCEGIDETEALFDSKYKQAEAEGYARGVEDQEKVKHMTRTQRVVLDIDINAESTTINKIRLKSCVNIKNEIQRGTGGGE